MADSAKIKRFNYTLDDYSPTPPCVQEFLDEIEEVCRRKGLSISHEDRYGGFIIEPFDEKLMAWFLETSLNVD